MSVLGGNRGGEANDGDYSLQGWTRVLLREGKRSREGEKIFLFSLLFNSPPLSLSNEH